MKKLISFLVVLVLIFSCSNTTSNGKEKEAEGQETVFLIVSQKDKEILNEILNKFSDKKDAPIGDLIIEVGSYFKETPYVAQTLELEPEQLVVNLRELDCTTFAENCLAIARTIKSDNPGFDQFTRELKYIRYRDGEIENYTSRLHYFSDWIYTNEKKQLVKNASKEIIEIPYKLEVNFMSTHPDSYKQLKDSSLVPIIQEQENEINTREMYYIPEDKIAEVEDKLMDGDIAGVTTHIEGMDIQHVVLLTRVEGRIHILHASSAGEKVLLSEGTLVDYLLGSKKASGIMVVRPN